MASLVVIPQRDSETKEYTVVLDNCVTRDVEIEEVESEEFGEGEVVECVATKLHEVKPEHLSTVLSLQKMKLVKPPSGKTLMESEHPIKFVCSNSRQGVSTDDCFDVVGKNVTMKLRSMERTQESIAERLIGEILFQGQMNMLSVNTTITRPNANNVTPGIPMRSIVINATPTVQSRREMQEQPKSRYIVTPHEGKK